MAGQVRRSEDGDPRPPKLETGEMPLGTTIEPVPGYAAARKRLDDKRKSGQQEAGQLKELPRPASEGSFARFENPENVIGEDDRVRIDNVSVSPYTRICALLITSKTGKQFMGTGWLIGPRTVITAGHCVFMHDEGGFPKSILVTAAMSNDQGPWGSSTSTKFRAVDDWTNGRDEANDYGAIILPDNRFKAAGTFTYAALDDSGIDGSEGNISGYPADRLRMDGGAYHQYFHARPLSVDSDRLHYDIDTYGGQSGSPIWIASQGRRIVVGIHTTGAPNGNSGTRIRTDVFDNLLAWKKES